MHKKSFTMIEMVFVIVIISVVGLVGTEITLNIYKGYITQRINNKFQADIDNTLGIISAYFKRSNFSSIAYIDSDENFKSLTGNAGLFWEINSSNNGTIIWIDSDKDSFRGGTWDTTHKWVKAGYSGFANLLETNASQVISPRPYNLTTIKNIQKKITNNNNAPKGSAIFFVDATYVPSVEFNVTKNFYSSEHHNLLYEVKDIETYTDKQGQKNLKISINATTDDDDDESIIATDRFYFTYGAYALKFKEGNLTLYSGFKPWKGKKYSDGKANTLMQNVHSVSFWNSGAAGNLLRIKICLKSKELEDEDLIFCRESLEI